MRRLFPLLLLCALPLGAAGQSVGGDQQMTESLLAQPAAPQASSGTGTLTPLWRSADGHLFSLMTDRSSAAEAMGRHEPLALRVVDGSSLTSTGVQYGLGPRLQAHAEVSELSWAHSGQRVHGSEVGATYATGRYSVGVSVGTSTTPNARNVLPRVLPGATPGVNGLTSFDSSAQLNASGRLALDGKTGIDLGASVGRIHLLPGNLLGVDTLDQKALSFGVDHGPLSGVLTGRTMQPQMAIPGDLNADRRWNSIDLGVTWRLPWSGSLSVGAQNLWSSGTAVNTPAGPEPDQSRTPYVQYHQDL
ncbi:hypothetical protein PY254_17050 [Rhodanobacter sp. AS-Z3]|uniref:hypothetical protein n=1 Tax=Rhodanobacter sp. AS-Z3 TaxID=3031330 RepID=UPI00247A4CFB|nr:hypothetical protein [Rhodanobacter sp. AS-Z3]WEN14916.1 hypothetical protein PY254_17050 [Rhodanobacter sp. AS-Z3]